MIYILVTSLVLNLILILFVIILSNKLESKQPEKPKIGSGLNLDKLSKEFDAALNKTSKEDLEKWLKMDDEREKQQEKTPPLTSPTKLKKLNKGYDGPKEY
jgi:hypothetical protein